ncbi:MAG: hypothetical protein ABI395_13265 [Sphingobium sp.]
MNVGTSLHQPMGNLYPHVDEQSNLRLYFYLPSGVVFVSQQIFSNEKEAWDATVDPQDMM